MDNGTPTTPALGYFSETESYFNFELSGSSSDLQEYEGDILDDYDWSAVMSSQDNVSSFWDSGHHGNLSMDPEDPTDIRGASLPTRQHLQPEMIPNENFDVSPQVSFPLSTYYSPYQNTSPVSYYPQYESIPPALLTVSPSTTMASVSPSTRSKPPQICDICHKKFQRQSMLERHMNTHTKPKHCPFCPRRSAENRDLERHIIARHSNPALAKGKFKCEVPGCNKSYKRKDYIARHVKEKHRRPSP